MNIQPSFSKLKDRSVPCPKAVAFWADIPKTVVGKILKKDVKKEFWEGKERMIS